VRSFSSPNEATVDARIKSHDFETKQGSTDCVIGISLMRFILDEVIAVVVFFFFFLEYAKGLRIIVLRSREAIAVVAFVVHSFVLLAQAITLSTCITAHNNALLALLVSNNFAEIKK